MLPDPALRCTRAAHFAAVAALQPRDDDPPPPLAAPAAGAPLVDLTMIRRRGWQALAERDREVV